jgi:UDP-glucose 4-epimerase
MRTVVTGGAGFIGSHLVDRLLAAGDEVVVVDNLSTGSTANLAAARARAADRLAFRRHDIRRADTVQLVADCQADVVYHLAAQADVRVSVARPAFDAGVNIIGSLNVFEGAARGGVRKVVFAGSGGTLYGVPESIPTSEDHPRRPVCPYGVAKKAAGDYLHYYREATGLDSTILALANVYGPRQNPHGEAGVVAIFGKALLEGSTPTIYGDGTQTRDFVFVGDVVDAFVLAAHGASGVLGNVGTGRETSVNELFAAMATIAGFPGDPRRAADRPGEVRRSALAPSLLDEVLGWTPKTSLATGLEQTIDWIRSDVIEANRQTTGHRPAAGSRR